MGAILIASAAAYADNIDDSLGFLGIFCIIGAITELIGRSSYHERTKNKGYCDQCDNDDRTD
jgi:hypothetical protein